MRKLQRYQHQNVYKKPSYPNNASYDLKSWWIKNGKVLIAHFRQFLNIFCQLLGGVEKVVFIH